MGLERHLGPWNASLGDLSNAVTLIVPAEILFLSGAELSTPLVIVYAACAWAKTGKTRGQYESCGREVTAKGWNTAICEKYGRIAEVWAEANGQRREYLAVRPGGMEVQR